MKVLLASPHYPQPRGNTVTVQRIAENLEKLGAETEIISITDPETPVSLPETEIVHGFHAYQFHLFMQKLKKKPKNYVLTMTGTDLNHDLFDPERRTAVLNSLEGAAAIHVFDERAKKLLIGELPQFQEKVHVIPQGNSEFEEGPSPFQKEEGTFLFLLPAGIRQVKNVTSAITVLDKLHKSHPEVRLWLAGPILEQQEGHTVLELAERYKDWLRFLGPVPHNEMGSLYGQADVVLNTSITEGQPAAIIEAMGYGKAVIVSDNIGNSSIVNHKSTGFVYRNENEFLDYAREFVNNYDLRQKIGQAAKAYIEESHSSRAEAEALSKIYNHILLR